MLRRGREREEDKKERLHTVETDWEGWPRVSGGEGRRELGGGV
jgi:hypothetical protein